MPASTCPVECHAFVQSGSHHGAPARAPSGTECGQRARTAPMYRCDVATLCHILSTIKRVHYLHNVTKYCKLLP